MQENAILESILNKIEEMQEKQKGLIKSVLCIENEITEIKNNLEILKQHEKKIEICVENEHSEKFNILFEGYSLINEKLDHIIDSVKDVNESVSAAEIASKINCKDIAVLKEVVGVV